MLDNNKHCIKNSILSFSNVREIFHSHPGAVKILVLL